MKGPKPRPLEERFLARVRFTESCWLWEGGRQGAASRHDSLSYGTIGVRSPRRNELVHRVAYRLWRGPIPVGMTVDHTCFQTLCVNPDHLRILSPSENSSIQRKALALECKRGHPFDEANTHIDKLGRRCCRACHREREACRQRAKYARSKAVLW